MYYSFNGGIFKPILLHRRYAVPDLEKVVATHVWMFQKNGPVERLGKKRIPLEQFLHTMNIPVEDVRVVQDLNQKYSQRFHWSVHLTAEYHSFVETRGKKEIYGLLQTLNAPNGVGESFLYGWPHFRKRRVQLKRQVFCYDHVPQLADSRLVAHVI